MATYEDEGIKKKGGGGKLSRSETVTVRLDPKLRYLAELGARKQRRTVSSFIEWALEGSLAGVVLSEAEDHNGQTYNITVANSSLWDVSESDRFVKLAIRYHDLLTYEEQVLWKLIKENGYLWKGSYQKEHPYTFTWDSYERNLHFKRLRENWEKFKAVAAGEAEESTLPTWKETGTAPPKPEVKRATRVNELEDEIPF